jgi:hypothetical protein
VPNMGRVFLLLHNLDIKGLLCTLHGFSRYGQDYKICSIGYIFATQLPLTSCEYFCISKPDYGISQAETRSALVRHRMKM